METLFHDLRYAARQMLRQPVFATVAVVTLAIGIGANTAIFSVVNGVLLAPLPLGEPDRVVWLGARAESGFDISVSIPNYYDWETRNTTFDAIGALRLVSVNLTGGDRPERLQGRQVIGDYFGALGRSPVLGRPIMAEETARGAERLAVISHALWQRRFDAAPDAVGEALILDGDAFTVVGVMPADYFFGTETDVWIPMGVDDTLPWETRGNSPGIYVVAHMRSGVTLDQVEADMAGVGRAVQQDTGWPGMPTVTTVRELFLGDIQPAVLVLFGAVGFVLLIACANIANLLLARAEARQREVALRVALGAGRGRIVRQLLTESVVLSGTGGVLGTLLALWGVDVLVTSLPVDGQLLGRVAVDGGVLRFTLVLSVVTGLLFGLLPALQASRTALHHSLKDGIRTGPGAPRGAVRNTLVVVEVALALILVAGAGLMIRSFARLGAVNPGFVGDRVITLRTQLPSAEYTEEAWSRFYRGLIERAQVLPGVQSAAVNNGIPMASGGTESGAVPDSRPFEPESFASALYQAVSGDYFETLGIPLRQGRAFTDQDLAGRPLVAIVDETMAQQFWPGESPIGRRVAFEFEGTQEAPEPIWREVVGVVGHVRHYELRSPSRIQVYVPYGQPPVWFANRRVAMALFVRTEGDPSAIIPALRGEARAMDPNLPIYGVQTMNAILQREVGTDQLLRGVLTLFAVAALLLAAVGIYGVMAYTVSRRTREIGVRMALGAEPGTVLGLVLRRALLLTGGGLAVGALAALLLSRVLVSVLFEVDAADPVTFAATAVVLAAVAGLASYLPARRAARVDPVVALRCE